MTTAPYFLNIPFKGTRSGVFPLTWGQHWVWESVVARAPHYADLSGSYIVAVPGGCGISAVTNGLAAVLNRYETFRSKYSITADGVPQQMVFAEGHLRVEVRDVDAVDAKEAAATAEAEFNNLPFTLPELSLRTTVIASDGIPRFVVLCAFHMAMDCHGMVSVLDDFRSFLSGRSSDAVDSAPGKLTHPADRALEEQDAKGVQRSARGVRYWEKELAKFPDDPLPYAGRRPESPRYKTFAMHSSAVRVASLTLAQELGVSTSSVILAFAASLLAKRSGSQTCGIVLAASHRYDPESMRYAGTLVQGVPAALDVSEMSPHRLISRCHRTGMLAALAGHCHPDDLTQMLRDSYGAEAAETMLACVFNLNLSAVEGSVDQGDTRATRVEAERLLTGSRYEYVGGTPVENERFYLDAHGDATDFFITLRADTAALTSAEIVEFLRNLERSLLDCLPHSVVA
ncbi:condensation domain-containing protein [Micromonospora sp. WMMA1363]|uniref:condensation domain-containing protein n=1 Tax=Micromonospora sp. WMMA1363 TaxID=3053985 RepID=UPI00259C8179|nr:condensation domain-containing protein [Micromonospora sp. WMMA1363]MDM4719724.1 condensation domain-containing protein [Micromonospora sp. WMMA1363]